MTNLSSFCRRAEIKYMYIVNTSTVAIALTHCDEVKPKADQVQHIVLRYIPLVQH